LSSSSFCPLSNCNPPHNAFAAPGLGLIMGTVRQTAFFVRFFSHACSVLVLAAAHRCSHENLTNQAVSSSTAVVL
jgi:hypothetical protein